MNGDGAATIGPDLNLPMNPTEYFAPKVLGAYIRSPQSVRSWPGMIMSGFSATAIADGELEDLIAYLGYMSTHRNKRVPRPRLSAISD
jgi:cytochrome c1